MEDETKSLSFVVAIWTAVAIAVSMAVYAVFQYLFIPGVTVEALVIFHLWHVLILGLVIYILCLVVFRRVVMQPLKAIRLHLYGVGVGRLEDLVIDSDVTEVRSIVEGINIMIHRMRLADEETIKETGEQAKLVKRLASEAQQQTAEIGRVAQRLGAEDHHLAAPIQERLIELNRALQGLVRRT